MVRNEGDIFRDLEQLCQSPGYVHAIAFFCFKDNYILVEDNYIGSSRCSEEAKFKIERLIRTEISTLIGLSCKKEIDETLPPIETLREYINKTDALFKEVHQFMMPHLEGILDHKKISDPDLNQFDYESFLREAIFYGGDQAYDFQYKDFSAIKYKKDDGLAYMQ